MAILVRDEADIIADNIRFHRSQGVDSFIVTDNGSIDGSRGILETLRDEVDIEIIDEPSHTIDQDLWMTRMAHRMRAQGRADWIILGDSDEFWVSSSGDLRSAITAGQAAIECPMHNMLPRCSDVEREDYRFFSNVMKVVRPIERIEPNPDPAQPLPCPILLADLAGGKIMCDLAGLRYVGMGNHGVAHERPRPVRSGTVSIFHYPVRTYDQFERKVSNYGSSLKANLRHERSISWHHRRWYARYERGELEQEYHELVLKDETVPVLEGEGVIAEDGTLRDALLGLTGTRSGGASGESR